MLYTTDMFSAWYLRSAAYIRTQLHAIVKNDARNVIFVAIIIGIVSGLAAVVLKSTVHFIQSLLISRKESDYGYWLFLLYPLAGILLTAIYIRFFHGGVFDKGVGNILFAIFKKASKIERHKTYSHLLTSGVTVGFGGSVGLEAPIVITGAAIGSNVGNYFRLSYKQKTLMLACGAAAGIAAIFNSPVAGVLFAVEALLFGVTVSSFVPLLISAATAAVVSKILYSGQPFHLITSGWEVQAIPFYILLGLFTGLISLYMTRTTLYLEEKFSGIKSYWRKAIIGGLSLGALIFIFPPLYGEGYDSINFLFSEKAVLLFDNSLFHQWKYVPAVILIYLAGIIAVKILATSLTLASGGNGGIFAPSLFTGAVTGYFFAYAVNLTGLVELNVVNFTAVAMAGILSGVIQAPLTAIFLIAEITGGYALIVPLMIVSAISFFFIRYFEKYSIYTKKLAEAGVIDPENKEVTAVSNINIEEIIERNFTPVSPDASLGELVEVIAHTTRNIFPVVNESGKLMGIVYLDDIREIMFNQDLYSTLFVTDMMSRSLVTWDISEPVQNAIHKFEKHNVWNIPVTREGKYDGFISKSTLFSHYRKQMSEITKM
ncbi:MAG: chloride channel protein [Ignavibacteriales bacterium]|nr:MAG: chloride channel protein [Ignavibacteriales bacterium]